MTRKYKFGDLVYYKPASTPDLPLHLEVIGFSERKNKYICLFFDTYAMQIETCRIYLCSEEDLGYLSEVNNVNDYLIDGKPPITEKLSRLDYYYFPVFEPDGKNIDVLLRKAIRHKSSSIN